MTQGTKTPRASTAKRSTAHKAQASRPLSILHVTPEAAPFARTGGLGDVAEALSVAQTRAGTNVSLVMPLYRDLQKKPGKLLHELDIGGAQVLRCAKPWRGVGIFFVRHDPSFDREGLYGTARGDYPDNTSRFSWLAEAAVALALRHSPDVLHLHDWQAALVAVLLRVRPELRDRLPRTRTLLSVHNLAYQGRGPRTLLADLGLPVALAGTDRLGDGPGLNLLKGGLVHADMLATVSRRYAQEIQTREFGHGLDDVLRERRRDLVGILNGIDVEAWDPAKDPVLAASYSARNARGKAACRRALAKEVGLEGEESEPIVGFVGRLAEQTGFDLLLRALPEIAKSARVFIVGNGDAEAERVVREAGRALPGRVAVRIGFDDALARRLFAGSDAVMVPSRFEPCGLVQMYAMRYGAIPVAHKVGGLAETIQDGKSGFLFTRFEEADLVRAVRRAVRALGDAERKKKLIRAVMERDFSWTESAAAYERLYRKLLRANPRMIELPEERRHAIEPPEPRQHARVALPDASPPQAASAAPEATAKRDVRTDNARAFRTALRPDAGSKAATARDSGTVSETDAGARAAGFAAVGRTRRAPADDEAQVTIIAQGPRRLYTYWQAHPKSTASHVPEIECRETGTVRPIEVVLPTGDAWVTAEPARHYRVRIGSLASEWIRTPPEVRPSPGFFASLSLWSLYLGPDGVVTSRRG